MDYDERKKRRKKGFRLIVLGIGIIVLGVFGTAYSLGLIDSEGVVDNEDEMLTGITRVEVRNSETGEPIEGDYWITFNEYKADTFFDPLVQKAFDECYYQDGKFEYYSTGDEFRCTHPEREIQIGK